MSDERAQVFSDGVEVIRDIKGVESIRPLWEQMHQSSAFHVINGDIDRYISVIRGLGNQAKPYVLIIRAGGKPRAILVGRIEKHRLKIKFGYKSIFEPTLSALAVEYGGILGEMTEELSAFLLSELQKKLKEKEFDVFFFNHLRTDSVLYGLSKSKPGFLCRTHFPKIEIHRNMIVPDSMDSFYAARSKKHRGNLKRILRDIDSAYPGKIRVATYKGGEDLEKGIAAAAQISRMTYQHALAAGFEDNELTRVLTATAAGKGWVRLSVLYVGEKPCSFQLGLVYNRTYFMSQIGFDPEFRNYSVGVVLFLKVLEQLCADSSVELIDFGFGDADYKSRFGSDSWEEASLYIFAPRLRTVFVNAVQTLMASISITAEVILRKTGLLRLVKRRWRDVLRDSREDS
ncbi:MAG: GNAT family N-acetyltransferase [Sedimentisphaerales bacterium]|nr:GNAT family N-acetyltransferase [Sedimentisphaerales bacterium]